MVDGKVVSNRIHANLCVESSGGLIHLFHNETREMLPYTVEKM